MLKPRPLAAPAPPATGIAQMVRRQPAPHPRLGFLPGAQLWLLLLTTTNEDHPLGIFADRDQARSAAAKLHATRGAIGRLLHQSGLNWDAVVSGRNFVSLQILPVPYGRVAASAAPERIAKEH